MSLTYYKATTPEATSFYDNTTLWKVGHITRHPAPDLTKGLCSTGVLHASDAPGETLLGGSWPCRLFVIEPRSRHLINIAHKFGASAWKVVEELPAWQALGPNGEAVAALIEQARTITPEQARQLDAAGVAAWHAAWDAARAARDAARDVARDAARAAARHVAWDAARHVAWDAARDGARGAARVAAWGAVALVVRDLITPEHFHTLAGPWESVMGPLAEVDR